MTTGKVISFDKNYQASDFPLEVRFYRCLGRAGTYQETSSIHSADDLHTFQDELSVRENAGEWIFIAYCLPALCEQRR